MGNATYLLLKSYDRLEALFNEFYNFKHTNDSSIDDLRYRDWKFAFKNRKILTIFMTLMMYF